MKLYLGLDGGGTKTAAVIINESGEELGRGVGGSGNIASNDDAVLHTSFLDAVREAVSSAELPESVTFEAVCAGVAGYSAAGRREPALTLLREIAPARHQSLHPDYEIAWWGATAGEPGIILIAGTGAVAYGRNAAGKSWKEDGLGYLLGDRGSGFTLGRSAITWTIESLRKEESNAFTDAILEATDSTSAEALLQWVYATPFSPSRLASLAPIVGRLADAEEWTAIELLNQVANQLIHTARNVQTKLWASGTIDLYCLGGLWNISPKLNESFLQYSHSEQFIIKQSRHDAAYGAALMALKGSQERGAGGL